MRLERPAALAVCVALVACGAACLQNQSQALPAPAAPAPPAANAVPSRSTSGDPADIRNAQQFANDMLGELAALRAGQSLGEWKKTHAG